MPLFKFICSHCGAKRKFLSAGRPDAPVCHESSMGVDSGGSTSVLDRLDNGIMARVVERPANIEELRHDHAQLPTRPLDDGLV
jgi:hypothetical protein